MSTHTKGKFTSTVPKMEPRGRSTRVFFSKGDDRIAESSESSCFTAESVMGGGTNLALRGGADKLICGLSVLQQVVYIEYKIMSEVKG